MVAGVAFFFFGLCRAPLTQYLSVSLPLFEPQDTPPPLLKRWKQAAGPAMYRVYPLGTGKSTPERFFLKHFLSLQNSRSAILFVCFSLQHDVFGVVAYLSVVRP